MANKASPIKILGLCALLLPLSISLQGCGDKDEDEAEEHQADEHQADEHQGCDLEHLMSQRDMTTCRSKYDAAARKSADNNDKNAAKKQCEEIQDAWDCYEQNKCCDAKLVDADGRRRHDCLYGRTACLGAACNCNETLKEFWQQDDGLQEHVKIIQSSCPDFRLPCQ
eukprot:gnl/TRDRNA2_/TRDRNA2_67243_c0_seq1.p1 gnl/TRDRNA2_/TRDRNA2_67243_c0~~gnl/TRDRNA2_/TRDRNA2_67243_c0_seq1.p1  ORF type:complete len:168 (+),score=30.92 gnl/TRDRNA2_/TRDRNA2_67243_c0_seq1:117-620(+)